MPAIKRCPTCKRSKRKAIEEQRAKKELCGFPQKDCYFYDEIKNALEKSNNIKAIKKEKKKKPIRVEKKTKKTIRAYKK